VSTYAEIWKTLSSIDCSKQTEKKQGLTYLSWAWAWGILMEHYPQAEWQELPPVEYEDGTVSVGCMIKIGDCSRTMRLPVMDHRNKAIPKPDAWARNKADMRAMTKCLALFGLGHYIYAGEDLPSASDAPVKPATLTTDQAKQINTLLAKCPAGTTERLLAAHKAQAVSDISANSYNSLVKRLTDMAVS